MNKPNLIIPGAAKSGTSSLHEYLNQHPEISMSSTKEPHFFCGESSLNGITQEYSDLFESNSIMGESSTGYMIFPEALKNFQKYLQNPQFIFILRNPIDRLVSHYNWLYGKGSESSSFINAINRDKSIEPVHGNKPRGSVGYKSYVQWGYYHKWIKNFYENFPRESILVITTETLKSSPQETMDRCFEHLGVRSIKMNVAQKHNVSKSFKYRRSHHILRSLTFSSRFRPPPIIKRPISGLKALLLKKVESETTDYRISLNSDERVQIYSFYQEDVAKLKSLTGMEFKEWQDFK